MDFLKLAKARYSVRNFKEDPIPQETIEKILEAGLAAPTACNNQPQKIIVVNNSEALERFRKCTGSHFNAPLAFIVSCDKSLCWKRSCDGKSSEDVDASIVASHMMLEAASLGIGSTWVMSFLPEAIKKEFGFYETLEPVALLVMGYPSEKSEPSKMHFLCRSPEEIVFYNTL